MLNSMFVKVRSSIKRIFNDARSSDFRGIMRKIGMYICKTIINFCISTALTSFTGFLCWLIYFRPYNLHPRVHSAILVTFSIIPAPAPAPAGNVLLRYDLSLNIAFLNKRGWSTAHFNHLTTGIYYNGTKIGPSDDTLPSFQLKPERRQIVQSVLRGQTSNPSATAVGEAFARERAQGQFNLKIRIKTTLTYRFFPIKDTDYYEYDCWLQFPPVPGDGTPAFTGGFKCGVAK